MGALWCKNGKVIMAYGEWQSVASHIKNIRFLINQIILECLLGDQNNIFLTCCLWCIAIPLEYIQQCFQLLLLKTHPTTTQLYSSFSHKVWWDLTFFHFLWFIFIFQVFCHIWWYLYWVSYILHWIVVIGNWSYN